MHRSIDGRQIVTVNHSSGFDIDISIINGTVLTNQLNQISNFFAAVNAQIPPEVAAQGAASTDYYRRLIASGKSEDQALKELDSPRMQELIRQRENLVDLAKEFGGEKYIDPRLRLFVLNGVDVKIAEGEGSWQSRVQFASGCMSDEGPGACDSATVQNALNNITKILPALATNAAATLFSKELLDDALKGKDLKALEEIKSAISTIKACLELENSERDRVLQAANFKGDPNSAEAKALLAADPKYQDLMGGFNQIAGTNTKLWENLEWAVGDRRYNMTFTGATIQGVKHSLIGMADTIKFAATLAYSAEERARVGALLMDVANNTEKYGEAICLQLGNFVAENGQKLKDGDPETWGLLVGNLLGGYGMGTAIGKTGQLARYGVEEFGTLLKTRAPTSLNLFNDVLLDSRLPAPKAGYDYLPERPEHISGYRSELRLANSVAELEGQTVVSYGGRIGAHGADVVSVDAAGNVTLWDSKFRSGSVSMTESPTFANEGTRLKAIADAIADIRNSNLPEAVRDMALENLRNSNFSARTVGAGNVRNSVITEYRGNTP